MTSGDMSEIFISCASERRRAAEHLAAVLSHYGYSAWFDHEQFKGAAFAPEIDRRMRDARAAVVLWCALSAVSRRVVADAGFARELGVLVPVMIEPCELPATFRSVDLIDLTPWDGSPRSDRLDPLLDALESRTGRLPHLDLKGVRGCEAAWRLLGAPPLKDFALDAAEEVKDTRQARAASDAMTALQPAALQPALPLIDLHEMAVSASLVATDDDRALIDPHRETAAGEWPAGSSVAALQRLASFARHFDEASHGEDAGARDERAGERIGEKIEAGGTPRNEDPAFPADGPVPVPASDSHSAAARRLLPGGGEPFCDLDGGPEMVIVPAGAFMMGSPDDERERSESEGPRHAVTFARPFAAGRHAVTRGQFAAFVDATGRRTSDRWRDPGFMQDDSHPVVFVTWDAAMAFASWLADVTGRPYRLMSEAEWEYAARAGTATPFWWGNAVTPALANFDGRYGTLPVGSFEPNPWGLYNVHGNVWEWCEDTWHASYDGAPTDGSAWISVGMETGHAVRGGSWNSNPAHLRAASRNRYSGETVRVGFRVARALGPDEGL
jgi:formylglycine-generating enzyme required for sulfatase activity